MAIVKESFDAIICMHHMKSRGNILEMGLKNLVDYDRLCRYNLSLSTNQEF